MNKESNRFDGEEEIINIKKYRDDIYYFYQLYLFNNLAIYLTFEYDHIFRFLFEETYMI